LNFRPIESNLPATPLAIVAAIFAEIQGAKTNIKPAINTVVNPPVSIS